jgi:hypothetical protein
MNILDIEGVKLVSPYNDSFFEKRLLSEGYAINKNQHILRTHVDWKSMSGFSFFYDYIGNSDICGFLKTSKLCNPNRDIILELNPDNPIVELSGALFAEKWEDIVNENSYGVSAISKDGELVFEFTDGSEYLLLSNFFIK